MKFKIKELGAPAPRGSMPALEAAKAAEMQGEEVAARFHQSVMAAHFEESLDISDAKVLAALGKKAGLNLTRFRQDLKSGVPGQQALQDYQGAQELHIQAVPTALVGDRSGCVLIVGEVRYDTYRKTVEWLLAR